MSKIKTQETNTTNEQEIKFNKEIPIRESLVEETTNHMTNKEINKIPETKDQISNDQEINKPNENEVIENKENYKNPTKEKPPSSSQENNLTNKKINMPKKKKGKSQNESNHQKEEEAKLTTSYNIWHAAAGGLNSDIKYWLKINPKYINLKGDENMTPLQWAVKNDHCETIKLLINCGADVNVKDETTFATPLHYAVLRGTKLSIIRFLLEAGADIEALDFLGNTPLFLACIKKGVLNNFIPGIFGYPESIFTISYDAKSSLEIIKELILYGANINAINKDKLSPLMLISIIGDYEILKYLVDNGAKVDFVEENDHLTPLHFVAGGGFLSSVKYLINNGANVDAPTTNNLTPIFFALGNNEFEVVKCLIEKGADINIKEERENKTPLHVAVIDTDLKVVRLLIESGANINVHDSKKLTPLHLAALKGDINKVKILIENGANINAQDENYVTALHITIYKNYKSLFHYLLAKGAEINMKDILDQTPLQIAAGKRDREMAETLARKGANLLHVDADLNTLRRVFIQEDDFNKMKFLFLNGLSIHHINDFFRYNILNNQ